MTMAREATSNQDDTDQLPPAGDLDAYEFYVWFMLFFNCNSCKAYLECPLEDGDDEAPERPWMRRNALRARNLGWYVYPLNEEGSLRPYCLCPTCAQNHGVPVTI